MKLVKEKKARAQLKLIVSVNKSRSGYALKTHVKACYALEIGENDGRIAPGSLQIVTPCVFSS